MGLTCAASGLGASVRRGAKWDIYPSLYCHEETNDPRGSVLSVTVSVSWPPVNLLSRLFAPFGGSGAGGGFSSWTEGAGSQWATEKKESDGSPAQTGVIRAKSLQTLAAAGWQITTKSQNATALSLHVPVKRPDCRTLSAQLWLSCHRGEAGLSASVDLSGNFFRQLLP